MACTLNPMTQIDFHILSTLQTSDWLQYIARLVQKARSRSRSVLIATTSPEQSEQLSQALWACQPETFLAHEPISQPFFDIQITDSEDCGKHHDILVNLRPEAPAFFSRFERVFEVVCQQPDILQTSRERYRFYNERGYELKRHDLRGRA